MKKAMLPKGSGAKLEGLSPVQDMIASCHNEGFFVMAFFIGI